MKKNEVFRFRLTDEEKAELTRVAAIYDDDPSTLVRKLVSRFIKASDLHGGNLLYPPQYNYIPANSFTAQDLLAAEETHPYKAKKTPKKGAA